MKFLDRLEEQYNELEAQIKAGNASKRMLATHNVIVWLIGEVR